MKKETPSCLNIEIKEQCESIIFLKDFFKNPKKIVDKEYLYQTLFKNNLISTEQLNNKTNYTSISTFTDALDGYCVISYADEANLTISANGFYILIANVKEKNSFFNNTRIEFEIDKNNYYMFDVSKKQNIDLSEPEESIFISDVLSGRFSLDTFDMISCINDQKFDEKKIANSIKEYDLFVKNIVKSIFTLEKRQKYKNK